MRGRCTAVPARSRRRRGISSARLPANPVIRAAPSGRTHASVMGRAVESKRSARRLSGPVVRLRGHGLATSITVLESSLVRATVRSPLVSRLMIALVRAVRLLLKRNRLQLQPFRREERGRRRAVAHGRYPRPFREGGMHAVVVVEPMRTLIWLRRRSQDTTPPSTSHRLQLVQTSERHVRQRLRCCAGSLLDKRLQVVLPLLLEQEKEEVPLLKLDGGVARHGALSKGHVLGEEGWRADGESGEFRSGVHVAVRSSWNGCVLYCCSIVVWRRV